MNKSKSDNSVNSNIHKLKIDILKYEIDNDSIISSFYINSTYTSLFLQLIRNPSSDILSKLVINYFSKMITDIKYIIKFKYTKLNPAIQDNISIIIVLLLNYNINIDTLIINLLRHNICNISIDHKYFKENPLCIEFINYHNNRINTNNINLISSTISKDIESDILFIIGVSSNIKFYVKTFVNKYKRNTEDILRFISVSGYTGRNVEYLVKNLNMRNNIKQIKINEPEKKKEEIINLDSILLSIGELDYQKYYNLIQNMKSNKKYYIDPKIYRNIIIKSYDYDNYVQVFLWKILLYQKILFEIEIEIDEKDLYTVESKEGYDIYLNIH